MEMTPSSRSLSTFLFFSVKKIEVIPVLKIWRETPFLVREKIWGQACKIAILSLFFACSFQNFISRQYPADGSLH